MLNVLLEKENLIRSFLLLLNNSSETSDSLQLNSSLIQDIYQSTEKLINLHSENLKKSSQLDSVEGINGESVINQFLVYILVSILFESILQKNTNLSVVTPLLTELKTKIDPSLQIYFELFRRLENGN